MRTLDVEENLTAVAEEIERFHALYDTDDFHLLSCGPDPQHVGEGGGAMGVLMWSCVEEDFEKCKKLIAPLLEAVRKIDAVVDVEVETAMDEDGEIWRIEFAPGG